MTFAQRQSRLKTHFSEGISAVKRPVTVMYSVLKVVFSLTADNKR